MFNFTTILLIFILLFCETYKIIFFSTLNNLNYSQKTKSTDSYLPLINVFLWFFFNKNYFDSQIDEPIFYLIYLSFTFFIIYFFFLKKSENFFLTLTFFFYTVFLTHNIIVFIITAELVSLTTVFVLFFSNTSVFKKTRFSIVYFMITNIIVFVFGVVLIFILFKFYGTGNIKNLTHLSFFYTNSLINILFTLYLVLKLGQGPIIFFKFRFYKTINTVDLNYYLFVYCVLIWTPLLFFFSSIVLHHNNIYTYIVILLITFFLLQSVWLYNSFTDFLVFSTWIFTWYVVLYTLLEC